METADKKALPKVLICNVIPLVDNGPQHSLAEMFSCWDKDKVSMVYARAELPCTKCCDTFFRINENAVIKSIFNRRIKTSSVVYNADEKSRSEEKAELESEKKRYGKMSGAKRLFMAYARELVWKFGKWKTQEFKDFLDEVNPDVLFLQLLADAYMSRIQRFIADYTGKPVVCYIADDTVTYKNVKASPLSCLRRFFALRHNRYLIKKSSKVFVMAPKAKRELDELYGIDCDILTKAIDFTDVSFEQTNPSLPLKMLYTGALTIGREKALTHIAKAVAAINKDGEKISFEIYSGDVPAEDSLEVLNTGGTKFCGRVGHDEVIRLQREADVLVYAESLEKKFKDIARLSFSTKLTDYFAGGKCIFALASEDIAPIEYLKDEDAALVVTSYDEIEEKLRMLCQKPELVTEYGRKAFECGKRNHSSEKIFTEFMAHMSEVYLQEKG